jgi:hypothetical protein
MESISTVFYYVLHIFIWYGVIDIYRATAAKDRAEGQVSRGVGQRDITVAIDIYLAAKKDSKGELSRTKLLDYCRRGKRWSFLAGPSPISVFVFAHAADTIVYVLPPLLPNTTSSRLTTSKAEQFYHGPDYPGR